MSNSINVALATAVSGLQTTQAALAVTSNNIANANTPGYSRKVSNLQNIVIDGQGAGVKIGSVTRQVNEYLLRDVRSQTTQQGETGVRQQFFASMQNLFGTPDSASSMASTLTTLGNKMTALAVDPASSNSQLDLVGAAQTLTRQMNDMSSQIQDQRFQADQSISDSVGQVNQLLQNIAELNISISRSIALNQPAGDLQDQRDTAVASLSSKMDISYFTRDSGEMVIFMASGQPLVDRQASTVSYTPASAMDGTVTYPGGGLDGIKLNGTDITNDIKSGQLRGLIDMRDTELPNFASEMDVLATTLKDQINAAHNDGVAIPPPATLTGDTSFTNPATDTVSLTGTVRMAVLNSDGSATGPAFDLNLNDLTTAVGGAPTVNQIRDAINGVYATATPPIAGLAGATASVNSHGQLTITANTTGQGIAINEGTSAEATTGFGFSHYFGLNNLLVGTSNGGMAGNIAVRGDILLNSQKVARGQLSEGTLASGDTAVAVGDGAVAQRMADIFTARLNFSATGGLPTTSTTLSGYGASILSDNATRASNANDADSYRQNLLDDVSSKAQSASGVSTDEEMANLIMYQNSYGASARVITTLADMMKTLTDMI